MVAEPQYDHNVQSGEALMEGTSARLTSTSAQKNRWEDSGDAQTIAEIVTSHKQYDSEIPLSDIGDSVAAIQKSILESWR